MSELIPLIGGIVHEGLVAWNEKRRTRFLDEHAEILEELREIENGNFPDYTDADLMLAQERYKDFLTAYHTELKAHNKENENA